MHGLETIVAMNRRAVSPQLYRIQRDDRRGPAGFEYQVVEIATGKAAFFGSKRECREWTERNGHDNDV